MRPVVYITVIVVLFVMVTGLAVTGVSGVRDAANQARCQNNLRQIGMAIHNYHSTYNCFPSGTVPNPDLPPEKRFSWAAELCPAYMEGGVRYEWDKTKAWDAEGNYPLWMTFRVDAEGNTQQKLLGEVRVFLCPSNPSRSEGDLPSPTHYLGIAGVGEAAAELPLSNRRAGFFGYNRKITEADLKDGAATTSAVAESSISGGPWTAGGQATIRGLDGSLPYLGVGGSFAGNHRDRSSSWSKLTTTNVLFADASARPLAASVSPQVFEAMATVAGGDLDVPE